MIKSYFAWHNLKTLKPITTSKCDSEKYLHGLSSDWDGLEMINPLNAYYCTEKFLINCKTSINVENIFLTLYDQKNNAISILRNDSTCFINLPCKCEGQMDLSLKDELNFKTKFVPIRKICAGQVFNSSLKSKIQIGSLDFICRAYKIYLSSPNHAIVDADLQTCSKDIYSNTIYFAKFTKSDMRVFLYYKLVKDEFNCTDLDIYYRDKSTCGSSSLRECSFVQSTKSVSLPLGTCEYYCPEGIIKELFMVNSEQNPSSKREFCEIFTTLLNTKLVTTT